MEGYSELSRCLSAYVREVAATDDIAAYLVAPERASSELLSGFETALEAVGIDVSALRLAVRDEPFLHLTEVFSASGLPPTPTAWLPVPPVPTCLAASLAILLMNAIFGMETVSYGSENGGALFVNLVALQGAGAMAEKSTGQMKGHTDAASFPLRGTVDPEFPRIAPSPDLVFLAAMRNEDRVPTNVIPLNRALERLSEQHATTLKGRAVSILAQGSFKEGTIRELNKRHLVDGTHVLFDSPEGVWVRYSHSSSVVYDSEDLAAVDAKLAFEAACASCTHPVALAPGDLLIVNNRKALHGRTSVAAGVGGQSRWLLRSYGLDTVGLSDDRRHKAPRHKLYP